MEKKLSALDGDPNELICGIPRHKYFGVATRKALIIVSSDYANLRECEDKDKYYDLPETKEDCKVILKGIKKLGFREENIVVLEEPSWNDVHLKLMETAMNLQKDAMEEKRTLFFFYYAGHGMSDNNLHL